MFHLHRISHCKTSRKRLWTNFRNMTFETFQSSWSIQNVQTSQWLFICKIWVLRLVLSDNEAHKQFYRNKGYIIFEFFNLACTQYNDVDCCSRGVLYKPGFRKLWVESLATNQSSKLNSSGKCVSNSSQVKIYWSPHIQRFCTYLWQNHAYN